MTAIQDQNAAQGSRSTTDLSHQLAELPGLDLAELRSRWRRTLRSASPELPRAILMRLLAYRLQARVHGDLDRDTARYLDKVGRDQERRLRAGERETGRRKAPPPVPAVPDLRGTKPGAILVREYAGTLHRVVILADGYAFEGITYKSLSEIARRITGTRWNGPRFFGLRGGVTGPSVEGGA